MRWPVCRIKPRLLELAFMLQGGGWLSAKVPLGRFLSTTGSGVKATAQDTDGSVRLVRRAR